MSPDSDLARSPPAPNGMELARRQGSVRPELPEMLFVSPVVPDDSGNGLAMRGALFLRAACRGWNVHLLVVDLFGTGAIAGDWPAATDGCAETVVVRPWPDPLFEFIGSLREPAYRWAARQGYPLPQLARFAKPPAVAAGLACFGRRAFARVHVFRLYLAPFAEPLLASAGSSLDLDDDDARTADSLAALLTAAGRDHEAAFHMAESRKWAAMAAAWAPRFDLVSLAAPGDADRLARSLPARQVVCVPNAVDLPEPSGLPPSGGPFSLLFVGTMGYLPNRDAALLLASEVLPALRRRLDAPVRLVLAGAADAEIRDLARPGEIEVPGRVADLRPLYAASHVALAPLRAGGGTRIKVLEAMAFARPVVATPLGVEGLAVEDGAHVLLGRDVEGLADACRRVLQRPEQAAALAARGRKLVAERYARSTVATQIERVWAYPSDDLKHASRVWRGRSRQYRRAERPTFPR